MKGLPAEKDMYLRDGDELGRERRSYSLRIERDGHYTHAHLILYRYRHITSAAGAVRTEVAHLHTKFQADQENPPVGMWGFYGGGVCEMVDEWARTLAALKFWRTDWEAVEKYHGKMALASVLEALHERGYRPVPLAENGSEMYPGRFYRADEDVPEIGTQTKYIYRDHQKAIRDAVAHEEEVRAAEAAQLAEEEEARKAVEREEAEEEARLNSDDALRVPAEV